MTKPELVKAVARKVGITRELAEEAINHTMKLIAFAIKKEGRFEFSGFGVFKKVRRAACSRPNPQDRDQKINVPAHNTVKFKPAPVLKASVNA